jgi:hypothetical protein
MLSCFRGEWVEVRSMVEGMLAEPWLLRSCQEREPIRGTHQPGLLRVRGQRARRHTPPIYDISVFVRWTNLCGRPQAPWARRGGLRQRIVAALAQHASELVPEDGNRGAGVRWASARDQRSRRAQRERWSISPMR